MAALAELTAMEDLAAAGAVAAITRPAPAVSAAVVVAPTAALVLVFGPGVPVPQPTGAAVVAVG